MIRKILIADRGDVARRILRACAELEVAAAVIFADADRHAAYVKQAGEAYYLGALAGGDVTVDRLLQLALDNGCDAIHPGRGLFSFSPELAYACERGGLSFIGPPACVLRRLSDKAATRRAMLAAGVPVVPGGNGYVGGADDAARIAHGIGYPVIFEAVCDDGEHRICFCRDEAELLDFFAFTVARTAHSLARTRMTIERAQTDSRRLEVPVLVDRCGNTVHLFEPGGSWQRDRAFTRAPLSDAQCADIGALAVGAAAAIGYESVGTVECLIDRAGACYVAGVNARLPAHASLAEHMSGIDIAQEQIRIAEGMALTLRQDAVRASAARFDSRGRQAGFTAPPARARAIALR